MRVEPEVFFSAAEAAGIDRERAADLWNRISVEAPAAQPASPPASEKPAFSIANVAYYFGALIVIGAMTFFMAIGLGMGGGVTLALAIAYATIFLAIGTYLHRRPQTRLPGDLLIGAAVSLTPLAVYGFEVATRWWTQGMPGTYGDFYDYVRGSWFPMELATLVAALAAVIVYRAPFVMLPLSFVVWYMSMDLAPLVFGKDSSFTERAWVSAAVGLVMVGGAFAVDRRTRADYAFWPYFFGVNALFFGCLVPLVSAGEGLRALFAGICLLAIAVSVVLGRRVFLVYGAIGLFTYLGHLSWSVFPGNPLAFTFCLTLIGLGIMAAGIAYQRNEAKIIAAVDGILPEGLRAALPRSRA